MKITFLGTAAAEGMPAVFCNCAPCLGAKKKGGKNIRTRSQIMVNGDLLIDFPADTYYHMIKNKLDLTKIENVFITHAHMDHCYPLDLTLHGEPYAHNMTNEVLNIYANKTVIKRIEDSNNSVVRENVKKSVGLNVLSPYSHIILNNYKIIPLPAVHTKGEDCLIYVIDDGSGVFMQFNDSGILPDSVYEFMADNKIYPDIISFDCTYGYTKHGPGRHMGVLDNVGERDRMRSFGLLKPNTKFILTHFSHNGGFLHAEMQKKIRPLGFIAAYDGMMIEI